MTGVCEGDGQSCCTKQDCNNNNVCTTDLCPVVVLSVTVNDDLLLLRLTIVRNCQAILPVDTLLSLVLLPLLLALCHYVIAMMGVMYTLPLLLFMFFNRIN